MNDKFLFIVFTMFLTTVFALPALAQGDCDTFYNHSGFIPGSYDYANFYEEGFEPLLNVRTNGENINVTPPEGRSSWDIVEKCHDPAVTTTSTVVTTTSTQPTTTTSETTTTSSEPTTTTVEQTTSSPPTTQPSSTTQPTGPSTTLVELPFTGGNGPALVAIAAGLILAGLFILVRETE